MKRITQPTVRRCQEAHEVSQRGDSVCGDSCSGNAHIGAMTPFTDRTDRFSALKCLTLAVLVAPAFWLIYRYWTHDLGPLALKEANHFTGLWTIRFLVAALALTPAQRLLNWPKLALIRRMTGIAAFTYAITHFTFYVAMSKFDLNFVAS